MITRERLEAYWRDTCHSVAYHPGGRKKFTGWVIASMWCEPKKAEAMLWLVAEFYHSDKRKLIVRCPLDGDYMSAGVVRDAIAGFSELRGIAVADLSALLDSPMTFTASATCAICNETETKEAIDEMPTVGFGVAAYVGPYCRNPSCREEKEKRMRAGLDAARAPAVSDCLRCRLAQARVGIQ